MQVLKKFGFLFVCFALAGCHNSVNSWGGVSNSNMDISEINLETSAAEPFRVGVLLPLSGSAAKYGQGLKNATMLALDDIKNHNMVLQFYDTKSTPSGARVAIENALNQRSQVILGPLMSSDVRAISEQTRSRNVPVIAFSTAEEVLQDKVYTLGLLIDEQVNRIIGFAASQGRQNFALLLPDNSTGISVAKAAIKAAKENNVKITKIAFYAPNTTDFSGVLKQMTNYGSRKARADGVRADLRKRAEAGDVSARNALKRMGKNDSIGEVDFDAVLIPESGPRLKSAIAMFGYYDVYAPKVKFLGTSIWDTTNLNNESVAVGSWYASVTKTHDAYFASKYTEVFGEKPNSLYALAYDAVALAAVLSTQPSSNLNDVITNPDGYSGINGSFRLFRDGRNEHSLDIFEVRKTGNVVIDSAPTHFSNDNQTNYESVYVSETSFERPAIIGKDKSVAESLIFGY